MSSSRKNAQKTHTDESGKLALSNPDNPKEANSANAFFQAVYAKKKAGDQSALQSPVISGLIRFSTGLFIINKPRTSLVN